MKELEFNVAHANKLLSIHKLEGEFRLIWFSTLDQLVALEASNLQSSSLLAWWVGRSVYQKVDDQLIYQNKVRVGKANVSDVEIATRFDAAAKAINPTIRSDFTHCDCDGFQTLDRIFPARPNTIIGMRLQR